MLTQIGSLDLWDGVVLQLMLVRVSCVQPEAFAWGGAACPARPLLGRGFADGCDCQRLHACAGRIPVLFAEAWINHVLQATHERSQIHGFSRMLK